MKALDHAGHERLTQAEDSLPVRPALLLILGALLMIAVGVVWPWALLDAWPGAPPRPAAPAANQLLETPFPAPGGAPETHAAEEDPLALYQWVDRSRGIVAIPIEHALDLRERRTPPDQDPDAAAAAGGQEARR